MNHILLSTLSYHSKCCNFRIFLTTYDKVYITSQAGPVFRLNRGYYLNSNHCSQVWLTCAILTTAVILTFKLSNTSTRPLSRRIPPPQPANTLPRCRRRKKFGAPPRQPKFTDAAAAAIFAARRGASDFNSL